MDTHHFDALARSFVSRRAGLALAAATLLAPAAATDARKKKKKKKCKAGTKKCGKRCIPTAGCCSDSECGANQRCTGDTCVCALECCTDAACGTGNLCVAGQCVTGQGTCPTGADICAGTGGGGDCGATGLACTCVQTTTGATRCASNGGVSSICGDCAEDASCVSAFGPDAFCSGGSALECCTPGRGVCVRACPA